MSMLLPTVSYIHDRYKKATTVRNAVVEMRITYNRKQKYMSTGIMLLPSQWKEGRVVNHPDADVLNHQLEKLRLDVGRLLLTMSEEGSIDIFSIPERLRPNEETGFIDYCRKRAEIRQYGKMPDTRSRYRRFIESFTKWSGIRSFRDVTENNIIKYDEMLMQRKLKPSSAWNNYHRFLSSFISDAVNEGLIRKNPYNWVNISREKSTTGIGKYLTPEEFRALTEAIMPTYGLDRVRDVFVFQTWTCMSYAELKGFRKENIKETGGMKVYTGRRQKTGKEFTVPLLKEALRILEKYDYRLPVISNVKYNLYLKAVAQYAGIDKPLSTHWARHTGATMLLNRGIALNIVSKICGHSSVRITEQVYAKLLDSTVVDAVSALE